MYISEVIFPVFGVQAKGDVYISTSNIDALSFGNVEAVNINTSTINSLGFETSENTDVAGCTIDSIEISVYEGGDITNVNEINIANCEGANIEQCNVTITENNDEG